MEATLSVAVFAAVIAALFPGLFLVFLPSLSSAETQKRQASLDRDLARYKHHPDANLLSLNN